MRIGRKQGLFLRKVLFHKEFVVFFYDLPDFSPKIEEFLEKKQTFALLDVVIALEDRKVQKKPLKEHSSIE